MNGQSPRPLDELSAYVEAYESAQAREGVDLTAFLPDANHPLYPAVLRELIRVDLEYGWKRGRPRSLEEYRATFPGIFQDGPAVQELAFEEYRLRCQAGQYPSPGEYERRYQVCTGALACIRSRYSASTARIAS